MQVPPHDTENEVAIIGSMLYDENGLNFGMRELSADMFYNPNHAMIFNAMSKLYSSGSGVDIVTLKAKLQEIGYLDQIGGMELLTDLVSSNYTSVYIKDYAKKLIEASNRRKAIQFATKVSEAAYSRPYDELINKVSDLPSFEHEQKDKPTDVLLQESVIRIKERFEEPNKKRIGLLTGLKDFDYHVGGLKKQDVIFLTAEPNVGKSILCLQLCVKTAFDGLHSAYFNFEMDEEYVGDRVLAMSLPIDVKAIHSPASFLTKEDNALINGTDVDKRLGDKLHIFTNTAPTIQGILTRCKELRAKGKSPSLIAVDYLQMMSGEGKSQMEQVENISKGLKRIAREFKCPVIVISSLSKDKEMRHSYQLRFDADVVLFMSEQKDQAKNDQYVKPVIVEVQKNRNGPVGGKISLYLNLQYLKFWGA